MVDQGKPGVEYCQKCGTVLLDGRCTRCASRRHVVLWVLLLILPATAFGACTLGFASPEFGHLVVPGSSICFLSPIAGVVYLLVPVVIRWWRNRNG